MGSTCAGSPFSGWSYSASGMTMALSRTRPPRVFCRSISFCRRGGAGGRGTAWGPRWLKGAAVSWQAWAVGRSNPPLLAARRILHTSSTAWWQACADVGPAQQHARASQSPPASLAAPETGRQQPASSAGSEQRTGRHAAVAPSAAAAESAACGGADSVQRAAAGALPRPCCASWLRGTGTSPTHLRVLPLLQALAPEILGEAWQRHAVAVEEARHGMVHVRHIVCRQWGGERASSPAGVLCLPWNPVAVPRACRRRRGPGLGIGSACAPNVSSALPS